MRSRLIVSIVAGAVPVAVGIAFWAGHAHTVEHWLAVHTGTVNEPGPYYGFWSGFGSDVGEFGIIGAIATAVYQLVRKHNCHEPRCWRVGNHSAADGRFMLCYRHHPDYQGNRPTHELIARLHEEHRQREAALTTRLEEIHKHLTKRPGPGGPPTGPAAP